MVPLCDDCIQVPSQSTPRIQECHILIGHVLCAMVEEALFSEVRVPA
jgi:D-sedoheptulose 7-phosphate isomerase